MYIQDSTCISSQLTFRDINLNDYQLPAGNKIVVIEPSYNEIPEKILRRMGKAVRLGVGAAMPLITKGGNPDGIIIGTANGGMEDCIKFLNQIIQYEEGMLTPTNFVQSTANAVAGQVGMLLKNKGYNITHVHRGHSFENALLDTMMLLKDNPGERYLVGAVDEISAYNYNIDLLAGWYKTGSITSSNIYNDNSAGSYPGEGAVMFLVSNEKQPGAVRVNQVSTITTNDMQQVGDAFKKFLHLNGLTDNPPDLYLSGEDGDKRMLPFYSICSSQLPEVPVARFKHISGEFATASAIGLWLGSQMLRNQQVPEHMLLHQSDKAIGPVNKIIIYNQHKGIQHSFILCSLN